MTPPATSGHDPRPSVPGPRACSLRPGFRVIFLDTTCWLEQPYTSFSGLSRKIQILKECLAPKSKLLQSFATSFKALGMASAGHCREKSQGEMRVSGRSHRPSVSGSGAGYQEMEGTSFACLPLDLATWRSKGISVWVGIHPGSNLGLLAPLPSGY